MGGSMPYLVGSEGKLAGWGEMGEADTTAACWVGKAGGRGGKEGNAGQPSERGAEGGRMGGGWYGVDWGWREEGEWQIFTPR